QREVDPTRVPPSHYLDGSRALPAHQNLTRRRSPRQTVPAAARRLSAPRRSRCTACAGCADEGDLVSAACGLALWPGRARSRKWRRQHGLHTITANDLPPGEYHASLRRPGTRPPDAALGPHVRGGGRAVDLAPAGATTRHTPDGPADVRPPPL